MNTLACNYAVARFLPYPETGEFVNVGIVLACPQTGFFAYRMEMKKRARVNHFFPELHPDLYVAGLHSFNEQLQYFRRQVGEPPEHAEGFLIPRDKNLARQAFAAVTRPREALFRFGPPATVLADDPAAKLKELFQDHVRRQFAKDKAFQEKVMATRLQKMLAAHRLAHLYKADRLGDDDYNVAVPFVHYKPHVVVPERAIKPLDLNRRGPTEILEHGDQWVARLRRLRDLGAIPRRMLFTVQVPDGHAQRIAAARQVIGNLMAQDTRVVGYDDDGAILEFATVREEAV